MSVPGKCAAIFTFTSFKEITMSQPKARNDAPGSTSRVSPPDVDAGEPASSGGGGGSAGGGGGSSHDKVWTISGRLCVREKEILDESHDGALKGIEVSVSARDLDFVPWSDWGTVRTDANGDFSLHEKNNGTSRYLRVQMRLVGDDLEVNESKFDDLASFDLLDTNWRTVWESNGQLEGPMVSLGTRVFSAGAAFDLGNETFRRQALIWYVLRTAIDRLKQEDPWFAMKRKMAAIYPAHVISGMSYTNGITRMIYLHQAQPDTHWHPSTALHEFMHLWNYDHNHGTINWLGAVCSLRGEHPIDGQTHNTQENPNVAFAEGCSNWASNALLHALWGVRRNKPLNRRYVAKELGFSTLEMVEKSEYTVDSALHLLSCDDKQGWWSHLFGSADTDPDNRPDDNGNGNIDFPDEVGIAKLGSRDVPAGRNSLSLWDVLRTFRASPANGWANDLEVGNVDYGIVRFIDRAVDIHHLGADVRVMLKRCIDPLATDEPRDALALKKDAA